jgi:hypothetical protein
MIPMSRSRFNFELIRPMNAATENLFQGRMLVIEHGRQHMAQQATPDLPPIRSEEARRL